MRRLSYRMAFLCLSLSYFSTPVSTWGQAMPRRFTNQDIIEMVRLGLSDDVIIAKIRSVSTQDGLKLDTSVEGLKALKAANVSDQVIKVMINPVSEPAMVAASGPAASGLDPNLPPLKWAFTGRTAPSSFRSKGRR